MSVARICDAGHTVLFKPEGGVIRNNETKFRGRNNVCRMTVKFYEEGFARQGRVGMEDGSLKYFGNL